MVVTPTENSKPYFKEVNKGKEILSFPRSHLPKSFFLKEVELNFSVSTIYYDKNVI